MAGATFRPRAGEVDPPLTAAMTAKTTDVTTVVATGATMVATATAITAAEATPTVIVAAKTATTRTEGGEVRAVTATQGDRMTPTATGIGGVIAAETMTLLGPGKHPSPAKESCLNKRQQSRG